MHYLFDFLGYACPDWGRLSMTNWGFMAKPKHPVTKYFLDKFKDTVLNVTGKEPLEHTPCFKGMASLAVYETGPYFFAMTYYHKNNKEGN